LLNGSVAAARLSWYVFHSAINKTTAQRLSLSTTSLFFTAAGVGLAIAAPLGPMGMLCIRRTLTGGPRAGLAIGFGIATGDALS